MFKQAKTHPKWEIKVSKTSGLCKLKEWTLWKVLLVESFVFFLFQARTTMCVTWETEELRVNSSAKALSLSRAQLPGYARIYQENPGQENGSHLAGWRPWEYGVRPFQRLLGPRGPLKKWEFYPRHEKFQTFNKGYKLNSKLGLYRLSLNPQAFVTSEGK